MADLSNAGFWTLDALIVTWSAGTATLFSREVEVHSWDGPEAAGIVRALHAASGSYGLYVGVPDVPRVPDAAE